MIAFVNRKDVLVFPYTSCGLCCKNIGNNSVLSKLDRGDGTCRHLDDISLLCTIYEERPLICGVEDYYKKHLTHLYEWDGFVKMNLEVCEQLKYRKKL